MTKESSLPDKHYRPWLLRGTREDAWKRAIAFYPKKNKPPLDAFVPLEIEISPEGICSLWPDLLSVEPGDSPYRFRLNDTLYFEIGDSALCVAVHSLHELRRQVKHYAGRLKFTVDI